MPPLTEQQEKIIRDANRRLAIFGLFACADQAPGRRHRFSKNDDPRNGVFKLNAESLFDRVKPELRFVKDDNNRITIGDLTFNGYSISTPSSLQPEDRATGGQTKSLKILRKSHLIEQTHATHSNLDQYEVAQQIGGELFRDLVKHLDTMVGFDHPHFVAGLTHILYVYVPCKAADKLPNDEMINAPNLQRWLERDVLLRSQLVKYLMELEDDDPETRIELNSTLWAIARGSEDNPFNPDDKAVCSRQIDAVVETLADLKAGLQMNSEFTRSYLKKQAGAWVEDIGKTCNYNFNHPKTGNGKDFIEIYRAAKAANDWVGRFIRTGPMHSFLFCWLASKYKEHKQATVGDAGQKMFEIGVKEVNGRVHAQSRAEIKTHMTSIRAQAKRAMEGLAPAMIDTAAPHFSVVEERIKAYFQPAPAFTRDMQRARACRLFITACQLVGGPVRSIHDENQEFADRLNVLQQHVLAFCSLKRRTAIANRGDDVELNVDELTTHLKNMAHQCDEFIDKTFGRLPNNLTIRAAIRVYVESFAAEVLSNFRNSFVARAEQITNDGRQLENLFGLWCNVALEGGKATVGLTNLVNLEIVTRDEKELYGTRPQELKSHEQERLKLQERQTATIRALTIRVLVTAGKERVESRLPQTVSNMIADRLRLGEPIVGRIMHNTEQIGKAIARGNDLTLVRSDHSFERVPGQLQDGSSLMLDFGPPAQMISVSQLEGDRISELFPWTTEAGRETLAAAKEFDKLAKYMKDCQKTYMDSDKAKAPLRRIMRAAKLAQVILAAPRDKINLDERDLSNVLGVMQEMVEKLGDPDAMIYANKPDAPGTYEAESLRNVNLSMFYPIADQDMADMDSILTYHYKLCFNINSVKDYLRELRELRDFFDGVSTSDLEVEVVNRTLGDYAGNAIMENDNLFVGGIGSHPPLVAYMTLQAHTEQPRGTDVAALGAFFKRVCSPQNPDLQFPLVVLAPQSRQPGQARQPGDDVAPGACFPVFVSDDIVLPDIDKMVGPRRIQNPPHLLWVAALLSKSKCEFGPYGDGHVAPMDLTHDLRKLRLPYWNSEISLHDYLRQLWGIRAGDLSQFSAQVIALKLANAAIMRRHALGQLEGRWPAWFVKTYAEMYPTEPNGVVSYTFDKTLFSGIDVLLCGNVQLQARLRQGGRPQAVAGNPNIDAQDGAVVIVNGKDIWGWFEALSVLSADAP